jgi:inhibitor of cysteine peptidase
MRLWAIVSGAAFALCGHAAAAPLTQADSGKTRAVARGAPVELVLPENPSTGYVWSFDIDPPSAAAIVSDHWTATSRLMGAPGTHVWSLKINQPGLLTIRAREGRPWEGEAAAVRRLEFRLDAR